MTDRDSQQRTILAFGAGNIGLSFVGQIFARSGYRVVFADTDSDIVERLNRFGGYTVRHLDPDGGVEDLRLEPIAAIDPRDTRALSALLTESPLIATAVGARAFPHVLRSISDALRKTDDGDLLRSLDVIAAENIHDPREVAYRTLGDTVPGIHACSVGKMVPLQDGDSDGEVVVRAESFNTLVVDGSDWRGRAPDDVRWVQLVDDVHAWMDRKLFIHNLGHSACAWKARSADPGIATIAEALENRTVADHVRKVMLSMAHAIATAYPSTFAPGDLVDHVDDLLRRFSNPALGDTVERVGRDLERKLGHDERLVGAMRLAARTGKKHLPGEAGVLPSLVAVCRDAVTFGLAGFATMEADVRLSLESEESGFPGVVERVSGLDEQDEVDRIVIRALRQAG